MFSFLSSKSLGVGLLSWKVNGYYFLRSIQTFPRSPYVSYWLELSHKPLPKPISVRKNGEKKPHQNPPL